MRVKKYKTACDLHDYVDIIQAEVAGIPLIYKGFQSERYGFTVKNR
jgi:hypothetical protein